MRTPALLAAALIVLTLTGCQPDDPVVIPQPEPSSTPLFASEEEALAAAEEAYAGYLAASDAIQTDGGVNPERIEQFVSEDLRDQTMDDLSLLADRNWHAVGQTSYDSVEVQQFTDEGGVAAIVVYACLDVSNVRIFDAMNVDQTPLSRVDRVPLELEFVAEATAKFVLSRSEVWSGDNFCK